MSGFTPPTTKKLQAPLDPKYVSQRSQAGRRLDYIEGWHAIAEANRIFGFDGWDRSVVTCECVQQKERKIGKDQKDGWGVTYTVRVRVLVRAGNQDVIREGSGAGHGIDVDLGQAHESAIKEAETDALKRALMTFGNPFGLALYDKSRENVRPDDGRMSKADARKLAGEINDMIDSSNTTEELDAKWSTIEADYIDTLPADWVPALKSKYETKREALKGSEA